MAFQLYLNTAWVETDGSYGVSDVILFEPDDLTENEWALFTELSDYDRLEYIQAVMKGEPLDAWNTPEEEEEN